MQAPDTTPPVVITGLLDEFPVERLLVFLEACGAQGRLALTGSFEVSVMYLAQGMVVHAQDGHGAGFEAFSRAILGDSERFTFESGVRAPDRTLSGSSAQLILKTMRRRPPSDRLLQTYRALPRAMVYTTKAAASHRAPVELSATEAAILTAVAGGSEVKAIAEVAGVDLTLTRHVLLRLATAGLVSIGVAHVKQDAEGAEQVAPARRLTPSDLLSRLNPTAPLGFRVSPIDARVFELVDGSRSLGEIGGLLGLDVSTVRLAVEHLEGLGLVILPTTEGTDTSFTSERLEQA